MKKILIAMVIVVVFLLGASLSWAEKPVIYPGNKTQLASAYTGQPAITPVQVSSPYKLTEEDLLKVAKSDARTAAKEELKSALYGSKGAIAKLRAEFGNLFAKKKDLEELAGKVGENQQAIENINGKLVALDNATTNNKVAAEKAQRKAENASDTADSAWTLAIIALLLSVGVVIFLLVISFLDKILEFFKWVREWFKRAVKKTPATTT